VYNTLLWGRYRNHRTFEETKHFGGWRNSNFSGLSEDGDLAGVFTDGMKNFDWWSIGDGISVSMHGEDSWKCQKRFEIKGERGGDATIKRKTFGRTKRIKKCEAVSWLQH
jgi:hypothetical protein